MHLSEDKQVASVEVHGNYTAAQLEKLIGELSAMRAAMHPAVPPAPPMTNSAEDPAAARARGDPYVQVAVMRDGMTRFWVRHAGLGWFGFNLPVERASMLANYILDVTARRGPSDEEFRRKRRQSDLTH
jgi:hypothetical protein